MNGSREAIEELLELLWTAEEDGLTPLDRERLPQSLRCFAPTPITDGVPLEAAVDLARDGGWVQLDGSRVQLTAAGRSCAELVVRRHRLTETLLTSVLVVSDESVEATACQMEHLLNEEVTDAVCAFLGHPPTCPHDRSIPRGPCCRQAAGPVEPLVIALAQLPLGQEARVAFIRTARHDYRQRLSLMGLVPGTAIILRQTQPTVVVGIGETELALDRLAASEIFVRRAAAAAKRAAARV